MMVGLGVDELGMNTERVRAALYATLEYVFDTEGATYICRPDGFSFVSECRGAGDDEQLRKLGQMGWLL